MQYYGTFDLEGKATGFYSDEDHGDSIPTGAVELSNEDYHHFAFEQGLWRHDPATDQRVVAPPPQVLALADRQDAAWARIKAERKRRSAGGVLVVGKWFHTDDQSRTQQLGLVIMGAGLPPGTEWKTMDGSFVLMTTSLAQQIFQGVAALDMANFAVAENHRRAMELLANPEDYDYSLGWLPTFGG